MEHDFWMRESKEMNYSLWNFNFLWSLKSHGGENIITVSLLINEVINQELF